VLTRSKGNVHEIWYT